MLQGKVNFVPIFNVLFELYLENLLEQRLAKCPVDQFSNTDLIFQLFWQIQPVNFKDRHNLPVISSDICSISPGFLVLIY
jgi:hypothetical protein